MASKHVKPKDIEKNPPFPPKKLKGKTGLEKDLKPRPQYSAPDYKAAGKLTDKKALITGGDSGIGRAVAVLYARKGADVAIVYLPEEEQDALETQSAVEAEGRECFLIPGDLSDADFCENAVAQAVKRSALMGQKVMLDYSSTKGAINAFTRSLAQNLVDKGIRVNAVAPAPVWTPLNPHDEGSSAKRIATFGSDNPYGRPAQPEEIAPAYVFLASQADSNYITGVVLPQMGGTTPH